MPARRHRIGRVLVAALFAALCIAVTGPRSRAQAGLEKAGSPASRRAPIVFRADEIQYDSKRGLIIAKGRVEIAQNGHQLLADEVSYNQRTDTVSASGHVSLSLPTGEILFSDFMEIRRSMNEEFAKNVRMLLADRSRLAANTARRTGGNYTELIHGVYSPCDLCPTDPTAPPLWQMRAREVDHDKAQQRIEFRDAVMQIGGWPVFYTPYFSMPDPTVRRQSGFLTPSVGAGHLLGENVTIPYYWAIDPSKDLTLVPRFTTEAGQVLGAEYRQRFGNGMIDLLGSINYSNVGSGTNENTGSQVRGHIDSHGIFDLNDTWRAGFDLQRVSDQTYLLRFGYGNPFLNTEISRAYLEGFEPRAATDANAYAFEPLQPGVGASTQPIVLPVLNRDWYTNPDRFGGRWHFNTNFLDIVRQVGTDTQRLSLGSSWERSFLDGVGGKYDFSASVRGDGYYINNLSILSNRDLPTAFFPQNGLPAAEPVSSDYFQGRVFPQLGLKWSYPIIHRGETWNALIEPIAAAFVGTSSGNDYKIPNEDSLSFNYTDLQLFRPDRLTGYDVLDTGQRIDYGTKLALYSNDGGSYRFLIGQSYRGEKNPFFPPGSGLVDQVSDVVGGVYLSPSSYLDLVYHFRLDKSSLGNQSQEVSVATGPSNLRLSGTYIFVAPQQQSQVVTTPTSSETVVLGKREQLVFGLTTRLTRYWSLSGSETLNLTNSTNLVNGVAVPQSTSTSLYATVSAIYQDECLAFIGTVTQSGIRNGDVTPGVSVLFSVVFKNLGELGGTVASISGVGIP